MAERLFRVLQLGKHIKDGNFSKPMQELARKLSTTVDKVDESISRGYSSGHIKDGNFSKPMQELSKKLSPTVDKADESISRGCNFGHIKDGNLSKPMQEMARRELSTSVDKADKFISRGYNFGHPPFGAHYGLDVPLGHDGLPEYVDWTKIPGAVWRAQDQGDESELCYLFSALGGVGGLNFIKTGESVELSAQQVLDCNTLTGVELVGETRLRSSISSLKLVGYFHLIYILLLESGARASVSWVLG